MSDPVLNSRLERLPLVTLYVTEECNSRCVTCDYWRHGRDRMTLESVVNLLPELKRLQTETVLLSGGEPLMHPQWPQIASAVKANGQKTWLLTSGLSLAKNAQRAAQLFDAITVSLDGADASTYQAIRGLDAFDTVCRGIRAADDAGLPSGIRVTLQRANIRQLRQFVELAVTLGAREISFLAIDVANLHAFARTARLGDAVLLRPEDLPALESLIESLERDFADEFRRGFIAQSPQKLRRILQYFAALCGTRELPKVRCNAPEFSAVVDARGGVSPCFFIPGDRAARSADGLGRALNSESMISLRRSI